MDDEKPIPRSVRIAAARPDLHRRVDQHYMHDHHHTSIGLHPSPTSARASPQPRIFTTSSPKFLLQTKLPVGPTRLPSPAFAHRPVAPCRGRDPED